MIKGKSVFFAAAVLLAVILGACSNPADAVIRANYVNQGGGGGGGSIPAPGLIPVNAANFESVLQQLQSQSGSYTLELTGNVDNISGINLEGTDSVITIKGTGSNTVTMNSSAPLFNIKNNVKLTLEDVTLVNAAGNTNPMIYVAGTAELILENTKLNNTPGNTQPLINISGTTVEMKDGTELNAGNAFAAVVIGTYGEITMSGATSKITAPNGYGIYAATGTGANITVNGGTISAPLGDGIRVFDQDEAVITVTGGTISGKPDPDPEPGDGGAGIALMNSTSNCMVTILGGTISGSEKGIQFDGTNNKMFVSGGEISGNENGITMWQANECELTVSGGTISGNAQGAISEDGNDNKITVSGGEISGNSSGIVISDNSERCVVDITQNALITGNGVGINSRAFRDTTTISITGGKINANMDGISIGDNDGDPGTYASNNRINMINGEISGNTRGITFAPDSNDNTLHIQEGTLIGNANEGIVSGGDHIVIAVTGGTISGSINGIGLLTDSNDSSVNIDGTAAITGNDYGIRAGGTTDSLQIQGGTINANGTGIRMEDATTSRLSIYADAVIVDNTDYPVNCTGGSGNIIDHWLAATITGNGNGDTLQVDDGTRITTH